MICFDVWPYGAILQMTSIVRQVNATVSLLQWSSPVFVIS